MIGTPLKLINWLYQQDKEQVFQVKKYNKQRNKDQNSKYWKLLSELSLALKVGIEELHFHMLKNYSKRYEILVPSNIKISGIEYYEEKSKIVRNNNEYTIYHVYTPSHELAEAEFAILLQGLCEECKQVGIETRSPDELIRDECTMR